MVRLFAILLVLVPAFASAGDDVDAGALIFADLAGNEVRVEEFLEDGPIILDFWATWCGPCKRAMPAWAGLADEYAEHGVRLVPVSWDHPRMYDRITAYFEKQGFDFSSLVDPEHESGIALGVVSLPTTFLISGDGDILLRHVGYADGDERLLESELRKVLDLDDD
jgi:thiol-disulfide isomerase/thioredoxin